VRTRITAALVAVLALLSWTSVLGAPAQAAAPGRLSGEITDHAGALGSRRTDVQAAITQLYDRYHVKLYIVYVPSFSGLSPTAWVDRTAATNGLGTRDILLGVATSDRNYAVSADPAMRLSTTQLDAVSSIAIEPALRQSNWPAAAIGAARGFTAVIAGHPVPAPSLSTAVAPRHGSVNGAPLPGARPATSGGLTGTEWAAIAGAAVLFLALLLFAARTVAASTVAARTIAGGAAGGRAAGGRDSPAASGGRPGGPVEPSTPELEAAASAALVETDDAVKTSEQELGFAVARFGEHAAAPFSAALRAARAELVTAFKLRQLLDDDIPETEPVRRSMLTEISGRCAEASRLLDEQSQAFDELQNLEARAPEVLAEVDHHVTQQDARADRSEEVLSRLAARYTPEAVAVVMSSPGQARERLEFARGQLAAARHALGADAAGEAAASLQAAEAAADQAESLLDGIGHMEAELTQAAAALPSGLRELDADLAEAAGPAADGTDGRAAIAARAQAAAAAVREQLAAERPFDTLAALRQLEEASAALEHSLAGAREERARQERARAVLDQAMLVARSSVTAAEDFITTRRGGVGTAARTRLAEAHRHFQQAIAHAGENPEAALAEAQRADVLGQQARSLAEQDVADFGCGQQGPVPRDGGLGGGFGGAILGGILVSSLLGGSRRAGLGLGGLGLGGLSLGGLGRGGLGRGGLGRDSIGGFGAGGLGPGSFGGVGTRGRHSIGGRF